MILMTTQTSKDGRERGSGQLGDARPVHAHRDMPTGAAGNGQADSTGQYRVMELKPTPTDVRAALDRVGYIHCPGVLDAGLLAQVRADFDRVWAAQPTGTGKVSQHVLLAEPSFRALVTHPAILDRHRALFGAQTQLLALDLLRQGPDSQFTRFWHRDFGFPGDHLLAANTLLYLDDIDEVSGPTYVVPGTHRGTAHPPTGQEGASLPGEVAIHARAGDAAIINAAIWHTGGRNRGPGLRRAIYLYFGWWWLKPYDLDRGPLPAVAVDGASDELLKLLGQRMPGSDLHMYADPQA